MIRVADFRDPQKQQHVQSGRDGEELLHRLLHNSLQQIDLYEEVLSYWRRIDHIQINCSECRFMQATVTSTEFLYMMAHHPSLTIAVRDVRRMKEFLADHLNLIDTCSGSVALVSALLSLFGNSLAVILKNCNVFSIILQHYSPSTLQYHQSAFRVVPRHHH